ncbi:hypothetical protein [Actinokineospora sp. NPDC004072]
MQASLNSGNQSHRGHHAADFLSKPDVAEKRAWLDFGERQLIEVALERGASWAEIAAARRLPPGLTAQWWYQQLVTSTAPAKLAQASMHWGLSRPGQAAVVSDPGRH